MTGNVTGGGFTIGAGLNIEAGIGPNLIQLAQKAIAAHTDLAGKIDFQGLAKALTETSAQTGEAGSALRQAVEAQLTPSQNGKLLRESDILATRSSNAKEVMLNPKALGFSKADFASAMDKGHSAETRAKVAQMWAEGKNLPRVIIADLKTANASFDPSAGPNGTITLNAKLINATDLSAGYGSFAAWGMMEEVGHWADRQAHIISGNPQGQTAGDEGARFAHAMQQTLPDGGPGNKMGFVASMTLGPVDGKAVRFDYDRVVLKGLDAVLSTNGHMSAENKVGNVEMYHPDGHYVGTFLNAMGVGYSLGMTDEKITPIAAELALGSQLPDMLAKFDALSLYSSKRAQQAQEIAMTITNPAGIGDRMIRGGPIKPVIWTPSEQAHLEKVYRGLHGMPTTQKEATKDYLNTERAKTSAFIEAQMKNHEWLAAGVAIHRLADLHAHVQPNGLPYWGDEGHGHEDAKGKIVNNRWGHSPDLLFYKANFDRFEKGYMPALQETLANGFKKAGMAKYMHSTRDVQEIASKYFRDIVKAANDDAIANGVDPITVTNKYHYKDLMKKEEAFVEFVVKEFKGSNLLPSGDQMEVGGGYQPRKDVAPRQQSTLQDVMNELSRK